MQGIVHILYLNKKTISKSKQSCLLLRRARVYLICLCSKDNLRNKIISVHIYIA